MKTYGLIGFPLSHSFSQKYFTEKFQKEGMVNCRYESYPIGSIEEIKALVKSDPGLMGLNVTIPYKQSVLSYLDNTDSLPAGLSACNCIRIKEGKMIGYNTDVAGFEKSLRPNLKACHTGALVLGNGGAADAIKFVLNKLKLKYKVVSRKIHHDSDFIYDELGESIIKQCKLIINTTPLGTFPDIYECPDIPYRFLTPEHFLYDLVYNPEKTLFLQKGEAHGTTIKNGYEMLLLQAEESWRIWNED